MEEYVPLTEEEKRKAINKLSQHLKTRTGLPFLECRKALIDSEYDIDKAIILLRNWHPTMR